MSKLVSLSLSQLFELGVHLGHGINNKCFFNSWFFFGTSNFMMIIDLLKTMFFFSKALFIMKAVITRRRPFWFLNFSQYFNPFVISYAHMCGECSGTYKWVGGTLTNFKSVIGWYSLLLFFLKKKMYKMSHKDKKQLSIFYGLLLYSKRMPLLTYISSLIESSNVVEECKRARVLNMSIIDTNMPLSSVLYPIPGNDDSMQCINFYTFLISKKVLSLKIFLIRSWLKKVRMRSYVELKKKFFLLLLLKSKLLVNLNTFFLNYKLKKSFDSKHMILSSATLSGFLSYSDKDFYSCINEY